MKKRLAQVFLVSLCLVLMLMHTQPVERLVFRKVQAQLSALGWQLDAKRFDLNLFRLSADFKDLTLTGNGVQASLEHLHANGSAGLLLGKISMDRVIASQGDIQVEPQPASGSSSAPADLSLPEIYLGEARFDQVELQFQDRKRTLNFAVRDISMIYQDQILKAGLTTPSTEIQGRQLPALQGQLSLQTATFQQFENVQLAIESEHSRIQIDGEILPELIPNLVLKADFGADLLPEHPGLSLAGDIDKDMLSLHAENQIQVGQTQKHWSLDCDFPYRDLQAQAPLRFKVQDLLDGQVLLKRQDRDIRGDIRIDGLTQGIRELAPQLAIEAARFRGEVTLPNLDVNRLEAFGTIDVEGRPHVALDLLFRDRALTFEGAIQPAEGAQVNVNGSLNETLDIAFNGQAANTEFLSAYVDLPAEVSSGPIRFEGGVLSPNLRDFTFSETNVWISRASYAAYFQDDLQLKISGPLQSLQGELLCESLNPTQSAVNFELDASEQRWKDIALNVHSKKLPLESFEYRIFLQAKGNGPLLRPALTGQIRADLEKDSQPAGFFSGDFHHENDTLLLTQMQAASHHGDLTGHFQFDIPLNQWQTEVEIIGRDHPEWIALTDIATPEFAFKLAGNQDKLDGRMQVPEQSLTLGDFLVPIRTGEALAIEGHPNEQQAKGHVAKVDIGGMTISDMQLGLEDGQIRIQSQFALSNTETLKSLLGEQWPADLEIATLRGDFLATSDQAFEKPVIHLKMHELGAHFRNEPLSVKDFVAQWRPEQLLIQPNTFQFAGTEISVATTEALEKSPPFPLDITLAYAVQEAQRLPSLLADQWPQDLTVEALQGQIRLRSDWDFKQPQVDFTVGQLEAVYNEQLIQTAELSGGYHEGVWVSPGEIQIGDLAVQITQQAGGIAVQAKPDMAFLAQWVPDLVGDATFDAHLFWSQSDSNFKAQIKQTGGRLIYPEPWVEVETLDLQIVETSPRIYELKQGTAMANGRELRYGGRLDWTGEEPDVTLDGDVENLRLAFADYQFSLNAVLQWHMNASENQLIGTVAVKDGYFSPKIEVEGLVQELLSPVPALFFPDPLLESVKLQVNFLTETAMVVEHDLGYWELETPALIIGGNLANPVPLAGSVNINEGSVLRQGRNTFLFQNSQVQFHRNRIGDPYLQIAMVDAANKEEKQPIYFTGYISEIDQNLGSQDITSFLLKFLLGRVTSLVSFEIQISDSLTESSFTTWVSRRLTDKVVVRYAIPLNDQEPLLEVKMGPFWRNFLNVSERENTYRTAVRHAQRFGFLQEPPETVRKVVFESENLPKLWRRQFKLEKGDVYSETRTHYALFDLKRRLKSEGYLQPNIQSSYENRVFRVAVEPGPKFDMTAEGLTLSEEEKKQLFLEMQDQSESSNRHLELLVEKLALSKGHPSAAAFAEVMENHIQIQVYVGHAIEDISLDFGPAQALIGDLYADKEESRRFVIKYFLSPGSGESELRARLAAKGYVLPKISQAEFPTPASCTINIDPGPRAQLFAVIVNGDQWQSEYLQLPFEYGFIAQTVQTLGEPDGDQRYQVRLTPRRLDGDIFFDVIKTELVDQTIEQLNVDGSGRIPDDKIRAFLGFKKAMSQSKLMKNQERLVETGTFTLARLRHSGNVALLEVRERNRWDMDYELSYDEVNELGVGVQFRDRMMFKGFNPLGLAVRRDRVKEEFIARQQFLRVLGTPVDFFVGLGWNNERIDLEPDQSEPLFDTVFVTRRPRETTEINTGISYRLFEHQLLTAGITFERIVTRQFEDVFFIDQDGQLVPDPTLPTARLADLKVNRVPLRTSWLYSNLDNELYPNRGLFSQLSYEYFPRALGTNQILAGWRALGKFNTFYTFGRWRWWQRFEAGLYSREFDSNNVLDDEADNNLFFLGGPKSIRGFGYQLTGPLRENTDGSLVAIGGQAMAIWTQELNFDLNLYGLGLSPFVDGGWVWSNRDDFLKDGMVITGGLGLTLETPIGRFRFDWATPLDDRPFDRMLDEMFDGNTAARDMARRQVLDEFSIRFGRVF